MFSRKQTVPWIGPMSDRTGVPEQVTQRIEARGFWMAAFAGRSNASVPCRGGGRVQAITTRNSSKSTEPSWSASATEMSVATVASVTLTPCFRSASPSSVASMVPGSPRNGTTQQRTRKRKLKKEGQRQNYDTLFPPSGGSRGGAGYPWTDLDGNQLGDRVLCPSNFRARQGFPGGTLVRTAVVGVDAFEKILQPVLVDIVGVQDVLGHLPASGPAVRKGIGAKQRFLQIWRRVLDSDSVVWVSCGITEKIVR